MRLNGILRVSARRERGALLLESLLAVVVMAIALTLIIQSMTGSLRAAVRSVQYTRAAVLADNCTFAYLRDPAALSGSVTADGFAAPFEEYQCRGEMKALPETIAGEKMDLPLKNFLMTVTWGEGRQARTFSLQTFLWAPSG